MLISQCANKE